MPASSKRFPLYAQILLGMLCGIVIGMIAGPSAMPLGELGKLIIQIIKTLAAPLLFFAIVDAFLHTEVRARHAGTMVAVSIANAAIAMAIGLTLSNVLKPGLSLALPEHLPGANGNLTTAMSAGKIDFANTFTGYIPTSLLKPFVDNAIIPIILVAVLIGAALRKVKNAYETSGDKTHETVERIVSTMLRAMEVTLGWVIALIPVAVFGVVAKVVGEQGFKPLKGLGVYLGVVLLGLALHVGIVYQGWLKFVARVSLKRFWLGARDPLIYVAGASSSLATLPLTLKALDKLGVSKESARLSACVGTNLNNDGILLYEALAILFVAQVHGIELSWSQQFVAVLSCLVAGIGITGVPEAGLISLSLALATVGLPVEILPLLLTVDWILSRARAITNVTSDMLVAVLLDHFAGRRPAGLVRAG